MLPFEEDPAGLTFYSAARDWTLVSTRLSEPTVALLMSIDFTLKQHGILQRLQVLNLVLLRPLRGSWRLRLTAAIKCGFDDILPRRG